MKHANPTIWPAVEKTEPAHSLGWTASSIFADQWPSLAALWPEACTPCPHTPGKHAKPFGKHHPATTVAPNLDVAA
ncbi:hypothetical protein KKR91_01315 [Arthrobacter jiangjiafuii]|uniref:Uncharacterized protein n=1 Tax=Arthrobacter jiangjiafuii TaxID=2817475 RepID=A0A975R193_9MICC|nr:hypothetical protein [Arthrobacter jiangjiafuii]MBP3044853.1 hypothetical protein [Arthrobacter jiangjiafuii]QWC10323.1 hypothetical protein KKR91_01315 [Arthrobacter jiangjiafuii]